MVSQVPNMDSLEYRGLSTDEKPVKGVINGAVFFEMDTGAAFMFNADSEQWLAV